MKKYLSSKVYDPKKTPSKDQKLKKSPQRPPKGVF